VINFKEPTDYIGNNIPVPKYFDIPYNKITGTMTTINWNKA